MVRAVENFAALMSRLQPIKEMTSRAFFSWIFPDQTILFET